MSARIAANIAVFETGHQAEVVDAITLARGIALAEFYLAQMAFEP